MTIETVTEPGFYNGVFLKPGAAYETDMTETAAPKLDRLKKDELIALAKDRGIEIDPSKTNAEIIAAIEAAV